MIGLFLFASGCFLFWPAAIVGRYGFFLFDLFDIVSGFAFLETGANIFIVELGKPKSAERRLNFSQIFNLIGAVLGVLIGIIFIFSGIELSSEQVNILKQLAEYNTSLQHETMRLVWPYIILAGFAFVWDIIMLITKFPKEGDEPSNEPKGKPKELVKHPHFLKGVASNFFTVGLKPVPGVFYSICAGLY